MSLLTTLVPESKEPLTALLPLLHQLQGLGIIVELQGSTYVVRGPYCKQCQESGLPPCNTYRLTNNGSTSWPDTNCQQCRDITNDNPVLTPEEKRWLWLKRHSNES